LPLIDFWQKMPPFKLSGAKKKMKNEFINWPSKAMVREKGLEPPRLTALEPKSSASTNFATLAKISPRF
jgi:hypothetical protein